MLTRVEQQARIYHHQHYSEKPWEEATKAHREFCISVAHNLLIRIWILQHPKAVEALVERNGSVYETVFVDEIYSLVEIRE